MEYAHHDSVWVAFMVTAVAAGIAAWMDFRHFRIPNLLTFPLCWTGLIFQSLITGWAGWQFGLTGVLVGFFILIGFYILGVMGAGDVKLLAACGAWIGPVMIVHVFFVAAIVTGMHSLAVLVWQRRLREVPVLLHLAVIQTVSGGQGRVVQDAVAQTKHRADRHQHIVPFGLMIAVGLLFVGLFELWV